MQNNTLLWLVIGVGVWLCISGQPGGGIIPDDAPFPADGLTVLIVYDHQSQNDLTSGERDIIFGPDTRDVLDDVTDDRYRIWSDDADVSHAADVWQEAMDVPREGEPWLVLSNGKTGTSQPLPQSADEFAEIIKAYQ